MPRNACGWVFRPLVLTISPLSRNMSETSTAAREQAARIVAQVEDQAFAAFVLELLEGFLQLIGRVLVEPGDADVADLLVLVDQEVPLIVGLAAVADDAGDIDDRAGERDGFGIFRALVQDASA